MTELWSLLKGRLINRKIYYSFLYDDNYPNFRNTSTVYENYLRKYVLIKELWKEKLETQFCSNEGSAMNSIVWFYFNLLIYIWDKNYLPQQSLFLLRDSMRLNKMVCAQRKLEHIISFIFTTLFQLDSIFNFFLFIYLLNWAQGLAHAKCILYHWAIPPVYLKSFDMTLRRSFPYTWIKASLQYKFPSHNVISLTYLSGVTTNQKHYRKG